MGRGQLRTFYSHPLVLCSETSPGPLVPQDGYSEGDRGQGSHDCLYSILQE